MGKNRDHSKFPNAITVLDNGNVGINQTSPSAYSHGGTNTVLEVYNSGTTANAQAHIILSTGATTNAGSIGTISWAVPNSSYVAKIGSLIASNLESNSATNIYTNMLFYTSNGAGVAERLRITASGNIGIGATNPSYKLSVANELQVGAQGGNDFTYLSGGSGYGSIIRNYYTTGINNELRGNGGNYFNAILGSTSFGSSSANNLVSIRGNMDLGATGYSYAGPSQYGAITFPRGQILFSNTNSQNQLYLANNSYNNGSGVFAYRNSSQPAVALGLDNGGFSFLTAGNGTADAAISWTTAIGINNAGQVQRPNQPSFLAYSTGFSVTGGAWYNVSNAITSEVYDITNNYNSSGRFTAPVSGRYLFYCNGWSSISSSGERYGICARVNDGGFNYIGGGNYCITDSPISGYKVIHNLSAGDYVDLWVFSAVSGSWGGTGHYIYWGGYLL